MKPPLKNKGEIMKCAYCGQEAKGTKEHIISSGVLDLFPECFLTYDEGHKLIHAADPMIKDVCAECNNHRLNYIDSYAKDLIQRHFIKKCEANEIVLLKYDYTMMQKYYSSLPLMTFAVGRKISLFLMKEL
jgi:hypothetical protein